MDQFAIEVQDLRKYYGATKAVDGISFTVREGEIFGMLGPNGAGKSTTIEIIEGLRAPDRGTIQVLGLRQPQDSKAIKRRIGIQLQTTALYPRLTVTEVLDLFRTFFKGRETVPTNDLIALVDLGEKRHTLSKDLSGGQRQRLGVALALVNNPDLVFLDEPTTGMDPQARRQAWEVIQALRRRGKTILMTTHYMEEAQELCDRVAIVDHGRILELDTPAALIRQYFQEVTIEFQDGRTDLVAYRAMPGVTTATADGGRIKLYTADAPRTMAALLERETSDGTAVRDLNVHGATLEDVFLKLTGRALRD
ncbi:MAG TPA: ABC transporter ATP-binding protein [Ktedonobacterales bacterium]|jgi:ABC-2 type transport system ATP-binding protein|nr:ABC transporter ATP-binding protein [Ktedonobacterales bacterium]